MKKYISFAPYYSGLSNIIMCYECAFAIAYITKRTLILPPNVWCLFISPDETTKSYIDIWQIFDKSKVLSEFDCVNFYDVPEFQGNYLRMSGHGKINSHPSYTTYIERSVKNVKSIKFDGKIHHNLPVSIGESNTTLTNDDYCGNDDFEDFSQGRKLINLSKIEDQIIHFEDNLFGCYWYCVYPGNENERNKMKEVINGCFKYNNRIYELASKVSKRLNKYNAIHVRRSDFLTTRKDELEPVSTPEKLKLMVEIFFDKNIPLYVSTDEKDKSFFRELRKEYQLFFYDDFSYNMNELDKVAVEQTICSNAEIFYGTYMSTYTSRINIMRGLSGKQSEDDMGINYYPYQSRQDVETANPWKLIPSKRWGWERSYHPQWKFEKDGKYYNYDPYLQ